MFSKFKKAIRTKILNYLIKDVLNFVTVEELLLIDMKKNVIINKTDSERVMLKRDAAMILKSELFQQMIKDVYYMSNMKAVKYSKTEEDVLMAKSWIFFTEYMKEFLNKVSKSR